MNLADFRAAIADNPDCSLHVEVDGALGIDGGGAIAPHFHVTEIGRVTKEFIDCGGKPRSETRCVLQTLVAGDVDHRLNSTKLAGILTLADRLDLPEDAPVEVEHQERSVSTDRVVSVTHEGDTLVLRLEPKQTACLAEDACGIPAAETTTEPAAGEPPTLKVADEDCCSGPGCC